LLARLLAPEVFGAVAIVGIFTSFLQVFVDSGLGSALIQKKDIEEVDFSSVFYFNIFICLVLYGFLYIVAPYISEFYEDPQLSPLMRVASLGLVITGLRSTQETYVTRYLLFKAHFIATTIAVLVSAVVGVYMAYAGYGAWAIVTQQLVNTGLSTILLWFFVDWRPQWLFSLKRLSSLLSFGWKVLGASLVDTIYSELRSLFIGKVYSAKDLAFYDRGKQFPYMVVSGANAALKSVMFPVLSRSQDDFASLKNILRRGIRISMFFISSLLAYLFSTAQSLILVLMTAKWLPCVVILQILCFDSLFWPVINAHHNAYLAVGKSSICLWNMSITKIVGILMLLVSLPFGVRWVAVSSVGAMVFQSVTVAIISKKHVGYSYREQISDWLVGLSPAFLIILSTWWLQWISLSPIITLMIQTLLTVVVFFVCGKVTKSEAFELFYSFILKRIRH
jgi:O-antigen/teichoic acid export membrane protein